jgi:HK97 family phage major capsid protein/HK97 family phage prohead protease
VELEQRAYAVVEVKAVDGAGDQRTLEGIATTPTPDRLGDIVESMGAEFKLPIPLLWQHDARAPVGWVTEAKQTKGKITFRATMAKIGNDGRLKERLDEAWDTIKAGLVRGVSIGFKPIEWAMLDDGGMRFTKWSWLELSLVTIPANADASIMQIRSIDSELLAASGREQGDVQERPKLPGVSGSSQRLKKGLKKMPKTISEQISGFEATRAAKHARMEELMLATEGETLNAEGEVEYDGLTDEVKAIDSHLTRLRVLEKANRTTLKAVAADTAEDAAEARSSSRDEQHVRVQVREEKLAPGIEFTRYAMCLIAARGNPMQAEQIAIRHYPMEKRIINVLKAAVVGNQIDEHMLQRTAVAGGTTLETTWAAPLWDYQQFAGDFVNFLRPKTIIGRFGTGGIPSLRNVPFNIQIPTQTSGGVGYWVGEGAPKPLTKFDFGRVTLRWAKVANIAVLTDELIRFSNPSAEALVRDSLAEALMGRLDTDFVDPAKAAVSNVSPASITNGTTPIASSAGGDADDVRTDVQAIMSGFITNNLDVTQGVWIMNPRVALGLSLMMNALGQPEFPSVNMNGGNFMGFPVITSNYVTDVIFVIANEIFMADDGGFTIDASREASLQMDNAPTNNSATPTATSMVSMFQTNSLALRCERYINWQRRRDTAVKYLTNTDWGGSGVQGT